MTKVEMFEKIKATCAGEADIVQFCDKMIAECVGNAKKLQERNELIGKVAGILEGDDSIIMTNKQLAEACGVTWQKMSHVTRAMVAAGTIEKVELATDGKKKTAGFKIV